MEMDNVLHELPQADREAKGKFGSEQLKTFSRRLECIQKVQIKCSLLMDKVGRGKSFCIVHYWHMLNLTNKLP